MNVVEELWKLHAAMKCAAIRCIESGVDDSVGKAKAFVVCAEMVAADLEEAKKHAILEKHGYQPSVSVE